ncbi:Serine/threonine-protein kinase rio1 [Conglomerata obtusa]
MLFEFKKDKKKLKDRSQRATFDSVLDNRTLTIINKLITREKLTDLQGCLSSGKEANVYTAYVSSSLNCKLIEAKSDTFVPCAIKIYQTSIMEFKDRLKYIQSERRFETFCNSNPRKLIKLWAEKEVRNLKRMANCGIKCPVPIYLKKNILIMTLITANSEMTDNFEDDDMNIDKLSIITNDFHEHESCDKNETVIEKKITHDGIENKINNIKLNGKKNFIGVKSIEAAPLLKDFLSADYDILYDQCLVIIEDLYKKCGLIHADLSEYNLLVSNHVIYVIDVGQSVEKSHDNADEFLLKDIWNINNYFRKKGCKVFSINEIFEKTTNKHVPFCLKNIEIGPGITIPKGLNDIMDNKDYKPFLIEKEEQKNLLEINESKDYLQSYNEIEIEDDACNNTYENNHLKLNNEEKKHIRKNNKKEVKILQREKRLDKIPKKEKKKREKLNKRRK